MLAVFLVTLALLGDGEPLWPPPAEGLSLLPERRLPGPPPPPALPRSPVLPAATGAAGAAAWAFRRRTGRGGVGVPPETIVVFVSGYGSRHGEDFDRLAALMGLRPEQVRVFDHRWAHPADRHVTASRRAGAADLATALQGYLAGLEGSGRPVYLVGHSLGGAALAELVARWDRHPGIRPPSVVGAALLEPPIAGGPLGTLQSLAGAVGLPGDGGYDPGPPWRDSRAGLGRAAGVPVVVIRNPNAGVTSFLGRPEGLRVLDVPDSGRSAAAVLSEPRPLPVRLVRFVQRVKEAHAAVLEDRRVARCLVAETRVPGSCVVRPG